MNPFFIAFLVMPLPVYALLRPTTSLQWRYFALLGMIVLGFVLLFASHMLGWHSGWAEYEACQQIYGGPDQMADECEHLANIADGAALAFYHYLGWLPAAMYIGGWEWLWRLRWRKKIKREGITIQGRVLGNVLIGSFCFMVFYILLLYFARP